MAGTAGSITLELSATWLDGYCQDLARRSATPEKRLAALDALNTFIAVAISPGEQSGTPFTAIRQTLAQHLDQARAQMLQEHGRRVVQALRERDLAKLGASFSSLSRDSFWRLLENAETLMGADETQQVAHWCRQWTTDAKQRAAAASPYPDALDLKAAGLDVTEFMAMSDLHKFYGG